MEFSVPFQLNFLYNLFIYFITLFLEGKRGVGNLNFPRRNNKTLRSKGKIQRITQDYTFCQSLNS